MTILQGYRGQNGYQIDIALWRLWRRPARQQLVVLWWIGHVDPSEKLCILLRNHGNGFSDSRTRKWASFYAPGPAFYDGALGVPGHDFSKPCGNLAQNRSARATPARTPCALSSLDDKTPARIDPKRTLISIFPGLITISSTF